MNRQTGLAPSFKELGSQQQAILGDRVYLFGKQHEGSAAFYKPWGLRMCAAAVAVCEAGGSHGPRRIKDKPPESTLNAYCIRKDAPDYRKQGATLRATTRREPHQNADVLQHAVAQSD